MQANFGCDVLALLVFTQQRYCYGTNIPSIVIRLFINWVFFWKPLHAPKSNFMLNLVYLSTRVNWFSIYVKIKLDIFIFCWHWVLWEQTFQTLTLQQIFQAFHYYCLQHPQKVTFLGFWNFTDLNFKIFWRLSVTQGHNMSLYTTF